MIKEYIWTGQKFHGVDGFNGVFHDRKADINLGLNTMAIRVVEFSNQVYKIRKIFA